MLRNALLNLTFFCRTVGLFCNIFTSMRVDYATRSINGFYIRGTKKIGLRSRNLIIWSDNFNFLFNLVN